eukprot:TRINITY_DN16475_c0_g3_i1.p1 TRINITY_DN16475_c0_g3~~TRINITY_DN16475_c0_g3_i1.p1  ORF type:complete len:681 (+),score=187.67 TRINITY_DN16475_c0_g3_i1:96-2045(+)
MADTASARAGAEHECYAFPLDYDMPFTDYWDEVKRIGTPTRQELRNWATFSIGALVRGCGNNLPVAREHEDHGRPDYACIMLLRMSSMIADVILKHKGWNSLSAADQQKARGVLGEALSRLEHLREADLKRQYEQRLAAVRRLEEEREAARRADEERHRQQEEEARRLEAQRQQEAREASERARQLRDAERQAQIDEEQCRLDDLKAEAEHQRVSELRCATLKEQCTWALSAARAPGLGGEQPRRGLVNLGNTCYMNSVLQALFATKLALIYINDSYTGRLNNDNPLGSKGAISNSFAYIMREMAQRVLHPISPSRFKTRIGEWRSAFAGLGQQDASELLHALLDGLHEDTNAARRGPAQSPPRPRPDGKSDAQLADEWRQSQRLCNWSEVNDTVGVFSRSVVQCTQCGHRSLTFEVQQGLELPIDSTYGACTLDDCIAKYHLSEVLQEPWECHDCKKRVQATKQLSVWDAPPLLIVTLKRFRTYGNLADKLTQPVYFPYTLDMTPHVAAGGDFQIEYELIAVVNHRGGTGGGHYTADTRGRNDGRWYRFSDLQVEPSPDTPDWREAYVLVYQRLPEGKPRARTPPPDADGLRPRPSAPPPPAAMLPSPAAHADPALPAMPAGPPPGDDDDDALCGVAVPAPGGGGPME